MESRPRNLVHRGAVVTSLLLMTVFVGTDSQDVCQSGTGPGGSGTRCNCQQVEPDAAFNIDCTGRSLTDIPTIPVNTAVLDLTNNNIQLIREQHFRRLDTLQKLILTGNPLECGCNLTDFKSWIINLESVSAQIVEGAVCGDDRYSGRAVVDATFCFKNRLCHTCLNAVDSSECTTRTCFPEDACQNEVAYAVDGSVSMNKSCVVMMNCQRAASSVNQAQCRQTDGGASRCIYCCQSDGCNQELNTINDTYVFPFRKPLVITTAAPSTTDTSHVTTDSPMTSFPVTTHNWVTMQTHTTGRTPTPLLETHPGTDSVVASSDPVSTSRLLYTGTGSHTSTSFPETASWRTENKVQTSAAYMTKEASSAGTESPTTPPFLGTDTAPTEIMLETSEPFSTTGTATFGTHLSASSGHLSTDTSHTDIGHQTTPSISTDFEQTNSWRSPTEWTDNKPQTATATSPSAHFTFTDRGLQSTDNSLVSETQPTDSGRDTPPPYQVTSETPLGTAASSPSTSQPTTESKSSSPSSEVPPSHMCPEEVTEGDTGVVTWPALIANRTAVVPCPYPSLTDPETDRYARRTCFGYASIGWVIWEEPDMSECPTASGALEELIRINITYDNVLDVSDQLKNVTSYAPALTADDVAVVVDALKSLLEALIRYPEKGQEIFLDAMVTANQMTSVKFEKLVESQKINRTTSRLLQLIDEIALHVPLLNTSTLTSESRAFDVIILDVADQSIDSLLFGGLLENNNVKPFVVLNGSAPENATDLIGSVLLPPSLLHILGDQLSRTQFLLYQDTTYFNVVTTSVEHPFGDLKPAPEGAVTLLSSAVISAGMGNLSVVDLREPILMQLKRTHTEAKNPQCAYWDTAANDKQGGWSTKGCEVNFDLSDSTSVVCECNHLTNFAMLMDVYNSGEPDPVHSKILAIISYIGCSLSILALTLAIATLGCCGEEPKYRVTGSGSLNMGTNGKARADRHTNILIHLSVGLILSDVSFLLNTVAVELELGRHMCVGMAVVTHYSLLAAMAWMALEAFNMYLALVLVFDKYYSRFMLKMCLFGWGEPSEK
ncbi:adhesion G-protein coupled receptor G4-like isoform X2 [Acanthaster planci]|uniref:Adhesion G-protein coupled receptor G4-like isoform X2 n=1 Tax=Acanthaster planci TaxID=133434 RepID=A0A8B7YNL0_ACAPL|nr:adhesion G-protein coupled receptor G4-like isoform X2 [Acanthaster planci]